MPFYESIFENGEHSIAFYNDDAEALSAINEHIRRAKAGEPGSAAWIPRTDLDVQTPPNLLDRPAQRVAKVLVYNEHPDDYGLKASNLTADVAQKTMKDVIESVTNEDGIVNINDLSIAILETAAPRVDGGPHDSNFKMKEVRELEGVES